MSTKNQRKVARIRSLKFLGMDEFFVSSFAVVATTIFITWTASGSPTRTESSDKIVYVGAGLSALIFGLYSLKKRIGKIAFQAIVFLAWTFALIGIFVVEHKDMSKEHPMGFGVGVGIFTLLIFPLFYYYLEKKKVHLSLKVISWLISIFVMVCVCLAYFQTDTTLLESGHSEYVINEIWSPAAGFNTYQEFIPQYVYLIGWILKPILLGLGATEGTKVLVLILTVFGFLCLSIMIWLSKKAWPQLPWPVLILILVPFSTPTPGWNRISFIGPASTLLSGPALRVLGGLLVGMATIVTLDRIFNNKSRVWVVSFPGIVSALIIWNNLDFGLAAFVASIVVLISASLVLEGAKKLMLPLFLLGHLVGQILVLFYLNTQGAIPNWSYFGWFIRQFGGGFGGVTIEVPGPVLISPPLMFASASVGVYAILRWKILSEELKTPQNWRSAVTAAFFGSFCVFALPYYINRSYHAGQMSILYIPLGIALVASLGLIFNTRDIVSKFAPQRAFPIFISSFMAATIFLIPNPSIEWTRINGGNVNGTFPREPLQKVIKVMPAAKEYANANNKSIGFFGEGGNYVHALNGFPSANIFNSPLDLFQSDAAVQLSCKILRERNFDLLLLTESAEYTFAWNDGSLCEGMYKIEVIPGIGKVGFKQ